MTEKQTAFRLSKEILDKLDFLGDKWGKNRTETLREIINTAFESYTTSYTNDPDSYTESYTENQAQPDAVSSELISALTNQLTVKDEQIATLSQALLNAQDQGKAAQLLHATEKAPELLETPRDPQDEPKGADPIGSMTFRQVFSHWRKARRSKDQ